jgi:Rrf2 family transcriptional regulator, nitric oxide-sensitive transcriptional repressor
LDVTAFSKPCAGAVAASGSQGRPKNIRLGDVVRYTEAGSALVECFGASGECIIAGPCRLKGILNEALEAFLTVLDGYTLRDLVHGNRGLARVLRAA